LESIRLKNNSFILQEIETTDLSDGHVSMEGQISKARFEIEVIFFLKENMFLVLMLTLRSIKIEFLQAAITNLVHNFFLPFFTNVDRI